MKIKYFLTHTELSYSKLQMCMHMWTEKLLVWDSQNIVWTGIKKMPQNPNHCGLQIRRLTLKKQSCRILTLLLSVHLTLKTNWMTANPGSWWFTLPEWSCWILCLFSSQNPSYRIYPRVHPKYPPGKGWLVVGTIHSSPITDSLKQWFDDTIFDSTFWIIILFSATWKSSNTGR